MALSTHPIFPSWDFSHWTDVDDRVRGGSSTSHLDPIDDSSALSGSAKGKTAARFWGHLDIDTLGGAGFASQRYRFGPEPLHLPRTEFKGIVLSVLPPTSSSATTTPASAARANTFTLVLKTTLPTRPPSKPKTPPQPEPSSLSYESHFTPSHHLTLSGRQIFCIDFDDLKVTYRGREVARDDPKYQPFHPEKIYEMSLMCRSAFGNQKGDFEMIVESIAGWRKDGKQVGSGDGWAASIWTRICAVWTGITAWVWAKRSEGKIALHDEEKEPLV